MSLGLELLLLRCRCFCACGCFPLLPAGTAGGAGDAGILALARIVPSPPFADVALAARLVLKGFRAAPARVAPRCFRFSLLCFLEGVASVSLAFFEGLLEGEEDDPDVAATCGDDGAGCF